MGIVQEQHPARARLFHQWQQMEWPVVVDSLNLLGVTVVPIHLLVDRHGVVQAIARDPDQLDAFLAQGVGSPSPAPEAVVPDRAAMGKLLLGAGKGSARRWRDLGDAEFLWGDLDASIEAYARAIALSEIDEKAHFRLGVAHLRRDATESRREFDFRTAVQAFTTALDLEPANYIWRRRIQQYGPQLDKPYPFYDWVATANSEITARGATPVPLVARLTDAERVHPKGAPPSIALIPHPDPAGKLPRDKTRFVAIEAAFAPASARSGKPVRLHVVLRPDAKREVHWNNEVAPLQVWIEPHPGWKAEPSTLVAARPESKVESDEVRAVEFELVAAAGVAGEQTVRGYAIYPVCEGEGGTCIFLRQDFTVIVQVEGSASEE